MSPGSVFASTICGAIIITAPTNVMNTKHNAGTDTHPEDFALAMIGAPAPKTSTNSSKTPQIQHSHSPTKPRRPIAGHKLNFVSDRLLPTDYTLPTYLAAIYNSADQFLYHLMMHGASLLPCIKLLPTNVPTEATPRPYEPYEPEGQATLTLSRCTVETCVIIRVLGER